MNGPRIIYIMGRGHSGSTMVDAILGNSSKIESIGELVSGLSRFQVEKCSCGEPVPTCDFWKAIKFNYDKNESSFPFSEYCRQAITQANVKYFFQTLFFWRRFENVTKGNIAISKAIGLVSNKPNVLDSSKEPTRALLLTTTIPNSFIIHLVRNPSSVVGSTYFRVKKGEPVVFLRRKFMLRGLLKIPYLTLVSASWSVGNLLAEIVKLKAGTRAITIRYEDFLERPDETISLLGTKLGLDLSELIWRIKSGESFTIGHNIGGNRFRFDHNFKVDRKRSARKMPLLYSIIVKVINLPLMVFYGYHPFKKDFNK